jgi:predicted DNA-binding ribbon-helix-helix protein
MVAGTLRTKILASDNSHTLGALLVRLIDPEAMRSGFLASALRIMAHNYWKCVHWSPLPDATYLPNYRTEYRRLLEEV